MNNEEYTFEDLAPWLVIVITLLGGGMRAYLLAYKGLWLDETISIWLANHSVADMLQWIVRIDQHPPLYYLLLHYWIALNGDTAYDVRLLSALFGAATIPFMYLIGKRLSGVIMGFAAAVFMAVSLFNIYFAQETRMYTFLTFNAAVAIYALVILLTGSRSVRPIGSQFREYVHAWRTLEPVVSDTEKGFTYRVETHSQTGWRAWIYRHRWSPIRSIEKDLAWVAFIVFSAATLLSHNTAVFFILAANIFVLGLMLYQRIKKSGPQPALQAPSFWNWAAAQIGILLLWSPWISSFIQQSSRVDQEFWIPKPTWDGVIMTLRALLNPGAQIQANVVMTWILCAVLFLGLVYFRKKLSIFLFLAALFAIPVLGELIVSIRRPIFLDRTLIWVTIPMFLLLAAGIAQLKFRLLSFTALGVLATTFLFSTGDYYRFVQKEDWSGPAGYVALYAENNDLVLFNSAMVQIPFDYYFKAYEDKYFLQVEKRGVPDMFIRRIQEPVMTQSDIPGLVALLNGRTRVWLVYSHNSYTDPLGLIPQTLISKMKLIQQRDYYGTKVQLYGVP
jgi:mannosyltransferase